jgi:hypothetical protein
LLRPIIIVEECEEEVSCHLTSQAISDPDHSRMNANA